MKRKVLSAFLLAGALVVTPISGGLVSAVASASENNSSTTTTTTTTTNTTTSSASGNNTTTTTGGGTVTASGDIDDIISSAKSGTTVTVTGVQSLSSDSMAALLKKNATFVLKYTYNGVDYVVTIPAGTKLTDDQKTIPVFGPLYLAAHFGTNVVTTEGYTVKSGDTMSRIARANNMTLAELSALNPQITNVNRISVGQKINLKK